MATQTEIKQLLDQFTAALKKQADLCLLLTKDHITLSVAVTELETRIERLERLLQPKGVDNDK